MLDRLFKKKNDHSLSPQLSKLLRSLNVKPKDKALYLQAFRHRSQSIKLASGVQNSNERLEYLGDAVIGLIVGEFLFQKFPEKSEGELSKLRAKIVSRENLNFYGQCLNLEPLINYQRGKSVYKSLLGNMLESLIGAIYLDQGYEKTKAVFIHKIVLENTDLNEIEKKNDDYKSDLIIYCQKNKIQLEFVFLNESAKNEEKKFEMGVVMNGIQKATGKGSSKREAEQKAAQKIMLTL